MKGLSKSRLLDHRQCPKRLWLRTFQPQLAEEDAGTTARFSVGNHVGEVARDLQAGGLLIEGDTLTDALALTQQALKHQPRQPLFEATVEYDKVLVRADLLLPARSGYRLVEVKSTTKVKDTHYTDAAIQAWVVRGAGMKLAHIEVAHLNTKFVYQGQGDYQGLLTYTDVSAEANDIATEIPGWVKAARHTLAGKEPAIEPGEQCHDPYTCPFIAYCSPNSIEEEDGYPPEILPNGQTLAKKLREEGYTDLRDVPKGRLENPKHQRVWKASVTGPSAMSERWAGTGNAASPL